MDCVEEDLQYSSNFKIRRHSWQTMSVTPGDRRRQQSKEEVGVGDGINSFVMTT